jgi:hypothetical protein
VEDLRVRSIILKRAFNTCDGGHAEDQSASRVGQVAGTCEDGNKF